MKKNLKLIFLTLLVYGLPVYIFSIFPFAKKIYPNFEHFYSPIINFLFYGDLKYSALGIIFDVLLVYCLWLLIKRESSIELEKERVFIIFTGLKKIFKAVFIDKLKISPQITKEEKTSLLFYLVKLFWTPLMIIFAIENSNALINLLNKKNSWDLTESSVLTLYFPIYIAGIFTLDTVVFSIGYLFESKRLKNIVKSVEPTILGWLAALACYGPFFDTFTRFAGHLPADFADFGDNRANIIAGIFTIIFFSIYVWATIALGFKASNLTNRGIVSHGPYKYVRHPAYIAKNMGWWLASIPLIKILGIQVLINLLVWSLIYFIRALTEERHLMQDPDYVEYTKKVKYMFIPGVF